MIGLIIQESIFFKLNLSSTNFRYFVIAEGLMAFGSFLLQSFFSNLGYCNEKQTELMISPVNLPICHACTENNNKNI